MIDIGALYDEGDIGKIPEEEVGNHHTKQGIEEHGPGCQQGRIAAPRDHACQRRIEGPDDDTQYCKEITQRVEGELSLAAVTDQGDAEHGEYKPYKVLALELLFLQDKMHYKQDKKGRGSYNDTNIGGRAVHQGGVFQIVVEKDTAQSGPCKEQAVTLLLVHHLFGVNQKKKQEPQNGPDQQNLHGGKGIQEDLGRDVCGSPDYNDRKYGQMAQYPGLGQDDR